MSVMDTAETRIFSRLASAPVFHPASADLFTDDWALEAGDIVTVKSGADSYSLPIYTMTLLWNGANRVNIQGTGNEEREPLPSNRRSQYRGDSNQYSSLIVTKERILAHIEDSVNSMRSYVELTASHLQSEFYDDMNSLRSYVELTASTLRSEFIDETNSLYSYIELTASTLHSEFVDEVSSLRSYVELTASTLRAAFDDEANSLRSYIELTASTLRASFDDDVNSLRSYVELTASTLRAALDDETNSLRSYVELTASHLQSEFYNGMNSLRSYVELTASTLRAAFDDEANSLRSYVELTASLLRTEFADVGNSLRSYVELTASNLRVEFVNASSSLRSYVELTASTLRTEFVDETASLRSYIQQTASGISAVVSDVASIKQSGLWINRDSIALLNGAITYKDDFIQDANGAYYYNSTTHQYELAPSGYSGARYRKEQNLHVEDGVGLKIDKTVGSSVASFGVYDTNNLTAGYIISMINGQSTATISADKINLEGYVTADNLATKISEIQTLTGMAASFSGNVSASGVLAYDVQIGGMGNYQSLSTAVKTIVQNTSPPSGQIGIIYTKFDGTTQTVNFNIADTQYFKDAESALWKAAKDGTSLTRNGATLTYVHPDTNPRSFALDTKTISAQAGASYNSSTHQYAVAAAAKYDGATAATDSTTTGTEAYDAGADSVTVTGASGWSGGANVLTLSNGKTHTTYMPDNSSASWTLTPSGNNLYIYCSVGGRTYNTVYYG